jgi:hypothetical protein
MITHLGNGCPVILPRHDNFIQRVLSLSDRLWICFIPDGAHVPFFALRNYFKITGLERTIFTSDAIMAAGLGPGIYDLSGAPVEVDAEGVEVSLRVHSDAAVDLKNLRARAGDPLKRAELLQALWSAGDLVLEVPGGSPVLARDVDGVRLAASLDAATDASHVWTLRALKLSRAESVARGSALGDDLLAAFARLLPLYRLVAWSAENDLVRVESAVAAAEAERAAHERDTAAREAAWKAEHDAEILRAREAAERRSVERAAAQERARPAVVQEAVKNLPKPEAPAPRVFLKPEVKAPAPRPAPAKPAAAKRSEEHTSELQSRKII